ncbi:hypothetical protein BJ165DRAFT_1468935 [Panaeolus papilionaceus]|nr:hypothetical protein BJ165DRAFT_1468935 [Panaeolus papilionaceus]
MTTTSSPDKSAPDGTALPSRLPPATGNIFYDSITSARYFYYLPCAREALMGGIVSGIGMGFIRGVGSSRPMVAANWAVGTFVTITLASWHICDFRRRAERERVAQILQHKPRQLKHEQPSEPAKDS